MAAYNQNPVTNWPKETTDTKNEAAEEWNANLVQTQEVLYSHLQIAQQQMEKYYNKKISKDMLPFQVGDIVMIKATNIKTKCPSKKLDHKLWGPFPIAKLVRTHAIKSRFHLGMGKIHSIFHIGMIELYRPNTILGRIEPPPPLIDIADEIYEVEVIRKSKKVQTKVYYLVSWKDYGPDEDTWEPVENLVGGGEDAVREFHETHPDQPRATLFT